MRSCALCCGGWRFGSCASVIPVILIALQGEEPVVVRRFDSEDTGSRAVAGDDMLLKTGCRKLSSMERGIFSG